jgi:hypothetical protein
MGEMIGSLMALGEIQGLRCTTYKSEMLPVSLSVETVAIISQICGIRL